MSAHILSAYMLILISRPNSFTCLDISIDALQSGHEYQIWKLTSSDRLLFRSSFCSHKWSMFGSNCTAVWWERAFISLCALNRGRYSLGQPMPTALQIFTHSRGDLDLLHGLQISGAQQSQTTICVHRIKLHKCYINNNLGLLLATFYDWRENCSFKHSKILSNIPIN